MTIKLKCRILDTLEGIVWSDLEVAIEADEEAPAEKIAEMVNRATYEAVAGPLADGEAAPGTVRMAEGDHEHGICWIDDTGHQGGSHVIVEWHAAEAG